MALIHNAAKAAKARIGQAVPTAPAAAPPMPAPADLPPRPAVNFFADEPAFQHVQEEVAEPSEALPEGAIAFDDDFSGSSVDDEGIPVWEDAP